MKIIFLALSLVYVNILSGQDPNFIVNYQFRFNKPISEIVKKNPKSPEEEKTNKMVKRILEATQEVESELFFNRKASSFRLKDKMVGDEELYYYKMASFEAVAANSYFYKNTQKKLKLKKSENKGILYLVEDPYNMYQWEITKETKIILGYKCYKAIGHYEEYNTIKKITQQFTPTVWFTPELPYPYGPKGYDGLPGLVLEVIIGNKSLVATDIKTNQKIKKGILDEPTEGKRISRKDFNIMLGENFPIK